MKGLFKYFFLAASTLGVMVGVSSCTQKEQKYVKGEFDFTVELKSGRANKVYLNVYQEEGTRDRIVQRQANNDGTERHYRYTVRDTTYGEEEIIGEDYITVDEEGYITPLQLTVVPIPVTVKELESEITRNIKISVINKNPNANSGANYSTNSEQRTEILGKLESFAMNNFLTGITLFENGGYIRYSSRVGLPTEDYIPGYGFGLLSEGTLTGELSGVSNYKSYLQSATSSETYTINAWNATGSQVGDLNGYITSSYWSIKLDPTDNTKYVWYPQLAKDTVVRNDLENGGTHTVENTRPVPVNNNGTLVTKETKNEKGLYRRWRVYVKTNEIAYRTASSGSSYNNRAVELADYEFVYKLLLTQASALTRGSELASDTSYGIKGGYSYFRNTKEITAAKATELWNRMKTEGTLGIKTGTSDELGNGAYIEFELINPVDDFTAMYTLSSSLYSPLPESFMNTIGGDNGWITAGKLYGTWGGAPAGYDDTAWITSKTLCLGPFYIERWDLGSQIVFARNGSWYETQPAGGDRYHIPGVHISVETAATRDPDWIYKMFNKGKLDSCALPKSVLEKTGPKTTDKQAKGDSTFKLNVNSCTQERSDYLFGKNGVISKHSTPRTVHPWMSNNNFLRGIFWSIDRYTFAKKRGVRPSYEYFADSYLSNPDEGESYNTTDAHKEALRDFGINLDIEDDDDPEKYGFNRDKAVAYFQTAIDELLESGGIKKLGTASNPTKLTIDIWWMYQSDIEDYGKDIKNFLNDVFNDPDICSNRARLNIKNHAVTQWEQVYNDHLMTGDFDLGFGAISGNSLNPLNFMEVLRSDNSSGFTLNWGTDTGKISDTYPINYDGKEWTYDSLWAAGDHGVIAKDGEEVKAVESGYMTAPRKLSNINEFIEGGNIAAAGGILYIPFNFVAVTEGVEFDIDRVQLYLLGTESYAVDPSNLVIKYKTDGSIDHLEITIPAADAAQINTRLFEDNELQDQIDDLDPVKDAEKIANLQTPFKYSNYNVFWVVEVYYNLTISGTMPTESVYYIAKNEGEVERSFARM